MDPLRPHLTEVNTQSTHRKPVSLVAPQASAVCIQLWFRLTHSSSTSVSSTSFSKTKNQRRVRASCVRRTNQEQSIYNSLISNTGCQKITSSRDLKVANKKVFFVFFLEFFCCRFLLVFLPSPCFSPPPHPLSLLSSLLKTLCIIYFRH